MACPCSTQNRVFQNRQNMGDNVPCGSQVSIKTLPETNPAFVTGNRLQPVKCREKTGHSLCRRYPCGVST